MLVEGQPLDRYMELQLCWRQGLRKVHECSYQKATVDIQVEEDQEHPTFSVVSDNWASLLLAHDMLGGESIDELAKHSLLMLFQHLGTAVWDFMQKSSMIEKEESARSKGEGQAMSSELVPVEEDAQMLFRVCGAQLHSMLELRNNNQDVRSKSEISSM